MIVDIHTHILPQNWPDWAEQFTNAKFLKIKQTSACQADLILDGKVFRTIKDNCWDPKRRIEECDQFGTTIQVLSTVPIMFHYWAEPKQTLEISRFLNDHIAEVVAKYPKRFVGLGTIPMQSPKLAVQELERCMRSLGMRGVQIATNINRKNLDAEEFFPFFEAAQDLNASIFVHPWDMMGQEDMTKFWLPWLVGMPAETSRAICSMMMGGVFEKFPRLKVAFAHGGGAFPGTLARVQHGYESRPDLCATHSSQSPMELAKSIYVDSLVHDERSLAFLVSVFGIDRIALGSDYPFPLGENIPGTIIKKSSFLNLAEQQRLLSGTALEWLGLAKTYFGKD